VRRNDRDMQRYKWVYDKDTEDRVRRSDRDMQRLKWVYG
jgi:hypothetical protein